VSVGPCSFVVTCDLALPPNSRCAGDGCSAQLVRGGAALRGAHRVLVTLQDEARRLGPFLVAAATDALLLAPVLIRGCKAPACALAFARHGRRCAVRSQRDDPDPVFPSAVSRRRVGSTVQAGIGTCGVRSRGNKGI